MSAPHGFSWIERPLLAALARPSDPEDFTWLRQQGIEVLVSLTEDRPRRDWAEEANLLVIPKMSTHMPEESIENLERCVGRQHDSVEQKRLQRLHDWPAVPTVLGGQQLL